MRRALVMTTVLLALFCIIGRIRSAPPSPLPADAAVDRYSGERAAKIQKTLSSEATRTVGTIGNEHGRKLLAETLSTAGFKVERQKAVSCTYHGSCAHIENVIGIREGSEPNAPGILLAAHHDSVPVSPGASDDGAGASAIVETARALASGPPLRHLLVVLLTDGEEEGLLGAEAFAKESPWARRIRTTINVDARGSSGPSQMFETSPDNAWLIELVAANVEHPSTSSLFYEVYKRMPNDTDFTVLKPLGSGVNFANIARIEHYHTPLDTFANASARTLQHHGENALAMARALDKVDLSKPTPKGDATWFDAFSLIVVRWPEKLTLPFAGFVFFLTIVTGIRLRARDLGLAGGLAAIVAGALASLMIGLLLKGLGAIPAPWIAHESVVSAALHLGTIAAGSAIGCMMHRSNPRALWAGTWLVWAVLGVGAAYVAPGTAYVFVIPTFAATFVALLSFEASCIVGPIVAAIVCFPLSTSLYDGLGFIAPSLAAVPTILLVTTILPMIGGVSRRAPLALLALSLAITITAAVVPKFNAEVPQRANVVFRQDEGGATAKVFIDTAWGPTKWGEPPSAMLRALGDREKLSHEPPFPWAIDAIFANTARIEAPFPEANVRATQVEGGHRKVTIVVRSPRRAPTIALSLPPARTMRILVEGHAAVPRWGYVLALKAVPDQGMEIQIDATGEDPIPLTLLDRTSGVPKETAADAVVRARGADVVETQDGDVSVLARTLTL